MIDILLMFIFPSNMINIVFSVIFAPAAFSPFTQPAESCRYVRVKNTVCFIAAVQLLWSRLFVGTLPLADHIFTLPFVVQNSQNNYFNRNQFVATTHELTGEIPHQKSVFYPRIEVGAFLNLSVDHRPSPTYIKFLKIPPPLSRPELELLIGDFNFRFEVTNPPPPNLTLTWENRLKTKRSQSRLFRCLGLIFARIFVYENSDTWWTRWYSWGIVVQTNSTQSAKICPNLHFRVGGGTGGGGSDQHSWNTWVGALNEFWTKNSGNWNV